MKKERYVTNTGSNSVALSGSSGRAFAILGGGVDGNDTFAPGDTNAGLDVVFANPTIFAAAPLPRPTTMVKKQMSATVATLSFAPVLSAVAYRVDYTTWEGLQQVVWSPAPSVTLPRTATNVYVAPVDRAGRDGLFATMPNMM